MKEGPIKRKKVICIILTFIVGIIIIGLLFVNPEELKYKSIESITLTKYYPPFTEYKLENNEINELIDCLKSIDFTKYDVLSSVPTGDGIGGVIVADDNTYKLHFLKPFISINGDLYEIEIDHEIFKIVDDIINE